MKMFKTMMMAASVALVAAPMALPTAAAAQEFPLKAGDYTSVSGIYVKDGGTLAYAQHLANSWVKNQEYAKSKGWISDYKIYLNVDARAGEPTLYLTTTYSAIESNEEYERRGKELRAWASKSIAQLETESGDRAEFRTIMSSMMLQEYTVR